MDFEWDENKNKINKAKHGISTEREDRTRIISARLAEKKEKEAYYSNC